MAKAKKPEVKKRNFDYAGEPRRHSRWGIGFSRSGPVLLGVHFRKLHLLGLNREKGSVVEIIYRIDMSSVVPE